MGDCRVCGHVEQTEQHRKPLAIKDVNISENGNDHVISLKINGNGFVELWCNGTMRLPSMTPFEAGTLASNLNRAADRADQS